MEKVTAVFVKPKKKKGTPTNLFINSRGESPVQGGLMLDRWYMKGVKKVKVTVEPIDD